MRPRTPPAVPPARPTTAEAAAGAVDVSDVLARALASTARTGEEQYLAFVRERLRHEPPLVPAAVAAPADAWSAAGEDDDGRRSGDGEPERVDASADLLGAVLSQGGAAASP